MSLHTQDSVLYALFTFGPDVWYEHAGRLDAGMFDGWRREMFEVIRRKRLAGDAVDLVTVVDGMEPQVAAEVDGASYLAIHVSRAVIGAYVKDLNRAYLTARARDIGASLAETGDAEAAKSALMTFDTGYESATVDGEKANALLIENLHHRSRLRQSRPEVHRH